MTKPIGSVWARSLLLRGLALTFAAAFVLFGFSSAASAADVDDVQQSAWGLADEQPSRAVDRFNSLGWAVEEAGGFVYVGGKFGSVTNGVSTESQAFLAALDRNTGTFVPTIRPNVGGAVLALEPGPDGSLFVGGEMDEWNGRTIGALAKIDPTTGELWPGFTTRIHGGTSVIRDLSLGPDGWMYAAGSFTTAGSNGVPGPVQSIVRFNPVSGAIDWSWVPSTDGGGLWGVSRSYTQNVVYISGWNNVKNGQQVVGLDATNPNTVVWDDFVMNFGCCEHMYDIQATPFGTVMAVGEQHGAYLYDEGNNWSQIRGHTTSYDSRYQASSLRRGGDYQDIEMSADGRTLYASCHCWGSHSTGDGFTPTYAFDMAFTNGRHTGLVSATVAYDSVTGLRDMSFDPYMAGNSGGWGVLEASDGCIWIAGGISAVGRPGSQAPGRGLARLCEEGYQPPNDLEPPASCVATISGSTVTVTWPQARSAADYVIFRSVNGGSVFWRGVSTGSAFIDSSRADTLAYEVRSRAANGTRSEPRPCTTEDDTLPLNPPANCVAAIENGVVAVNWPTAQGAAEYIVYRSVDGGSQFWRGRTAATNFSDTDRAGDLTYFVASRSGAGELSSRTECTTENNDAPVLPIAACSVAVANNTATVSWAAAPNADAATEYIIYRSIDGGTEFWRGRTGALSFDDPLRNGEIQYLVAVRQGNETTTRTPCEPVV